VELIEMPFTVITCADVLLVNLERVGFNLRNFDMTIVFKVHIPPVSVTNAQDTRRGIHAYAPWQ
jgi:nucleosome binding factor SPN SPT16 subunit